MGLVDGGEGLKLPFAGNRDWGERQYVCACIQATSHIKRVTLSLC